MPELPEVETTRKGLEPLITDRKIKSIHIYKKNLRWEVPSHLKSTLKDQQIKKISRLAKYLPGITVTLLDQNLRRPTICDTDTV